LSRDARNSPLIWGLLQRNDADQRLAAALAPEFLTFYTGNSYYWSFEKVTPFQRRFLTRDASPHATFAAGHWERLEALSLLLQIVPDQAVEAATALADRELPARDQAALLQVRLLGEAADAAPQLAIAALQSGSNESRAVAARFLALGSGAISEVEGLTLSHAGNSFVWGGSEDAWNPTPPAGLSAEALRPLLQSGDPQTVLCAKYLLVLLGEADALPAILDHWKSLSEPDAATMQLVYRAVVAANDSRGLPVLESIYQKLKPEDERYRLRDFYWTVRIMTGPEALAFRKKIREEVGMENLR
jgi:hypothetical protein